MSEIKFGTDGWRAVIADKFTFANVRVVSQAIADYIKEEGMDKQGIVVGFDPRFLSEEFAVAVAEVMAGNWIQVFQTPHPTPTPAVAFSVRAKETAGAVMLTASHNPPRYHGIKFIPHYAGPATPHITDKIMDNVNKIKETGDIEIRDWKEGKDSGLIKNYNPQNSYLQHLQSLVNTDAIRRSGLKIIVDPMHGAGIGYLEKLLTSLGCTVSNINSTRDPYFGNLLPDPTQDNLASLQFKVREQEADIGLALDGDGDRLGIIDSRGNFFSPNQILFLLLKHLIKTRNWEGLVVRTVATTHMLDRIGREHDVEVEETPVGFKYIGELMMKKGAFFGGEESGGLSIKGHVPEKDGILGCLLFLEMMAMEGKAPMEIMENIYNEYGRLESRRLDIECSQEKKEKVLKKLEAFDPYSLRGKKVLTANLRDGWKFLLEDESWCLIRASGTEPVFRIYAEASSEEEVLAIQKEVRESLGL
ncbi:MAG: phosphoglucomutase/phosphomannomutase family protein [Candidatus Syntrophonatronum acetioxidans]|uniref:Phosphoglucomutase n=1 Tax=Candidatus Syntrophonatronum acetioxidans TaxID=1795816 RepID=A0A424YEV1_9FIRM|nr:MAG: phosphoglucomutase/phosphomannomutase family protein [Candidatus Syntrophonatronum acetioxidans]